MKKILTSETFIIIIFSIIFAVLSVVAFNWATEPEQWYVGMHDSKCESVYGKKDCGCYNRLVKADKARYGKN